MEPNAARPQNMIETTDALEAVSACQSMKNFLFTIAMIAMALCQIIFWMNHFDLIEKGSCSSCQESVVPADSTCPVPSKCSFGPKPQAKVLDIVSAPVYLAATTETAQVSQNETVTAESEAINNIEEAIDQIVESANQAKAAEIEEDILLEKESDYIPAEIPTEDAAAEMLEPVEESPEDAESSEQAASLDKLSLFRISCCFASGVVAVCNFIILTAVMLYSLSLLICLKISLAGRLGGINHVTRAFFVSLFLLVIVVPWQVVLPKVLIGSVWLPGELLCGGWAKTDTSIFWKVMLYLRFCGLWLVAVWLLLLTQIRSAKWARATLRRLGVVR